MQWIHSVSEASRFAFSDARLQRGQSVTLGHPLGVARRREMIPLDGDVDRHPNPATMAGLDLPESNSFCR